MSEPLENGHPSPDRTQSGGIGLTSPTALLNVVIAQASFIAGLMFYLGAIYTSRYYDYFHLSPFSLGFGFAQLVLQSLNLLRLPVLVAVVVILVAAGLPRVPIRPTAPARRHTSLPDRIAHRVASAVTAVGRFHLAVVACGVILLLMWPLIQPYGWAAPLLIAVGLCLGQRRDARSDRPERSPRRAVSLFAAILFLFAAVTQVAWHLGEQDAKAHAADVVRWTGVVLLSTEPLSLPTHSILKEDLGEGVRHRYRYTGLRLLVERDGRYYIVPVGWNARTDPVYVIRESDTTWIGLMPGVQRTD